MKKYLHICLFLFSITITSQTFDWVQTPSINFNSSPSLIGYNTTCDINGNVYCAGYLDNSYNYTEIFGDLFYKKYDSTGQELFSKNISGKVQVYDIKPDSQGNIYLAVAYLQSMSIDNTIISTNNQGVQPVLLKFDSNGNLLWHISLSSFNISINHFNSIAIDNQDFVYICYDDYYFSYVKKLDSNGTILLTIEQQNVNLISSISVDNEGYIYTAGSCANSNSKYAGVTVPATFLYNTYIAKYSPTGIYQWVKYVQDITCSEPQVKARSQEEVYFSSTLYGAYSFDSIVAEGPTNFGYDFFLAKLNSSGNFQWVKEVTGNGKVFVGKRDFLHLDSTGNIYLAGSTADNINWGNSIITNSTIYQDAIVLKYNSNGTLLLAKTAGGTDTDRFDSVTTNTIGDIFVAGMMRGTSNFDAIQHAEPDQYKSYPVLAKINISNLETTKFETETTIIYPNPSKDYFFIKVSKKYLKGEIYSILGKKIKTFESNDAPISIQELDNGIYYVRIENNFYKLIKS